MCREVCAYLCDHSTLERVEVYLWNYQQQQERFKAIDPFHVRRSHRFGSCPGVGLYDEKWDTISFNKWIDELQFSIR